jgi:sortase A
VWQGGGVRHAPRRPSVSDDAGVHRVLHVISVALITAGLVVLADVGLTLVWKEPLSTVYGSFQQGEAEDELATLEARFPSDELLAEVARTDNVTEKAEILADAFAKEAEAPSGIGRIAIPAIDLDIVVVEGTETTSLQKGPGHYSLDDDEQQQKLGDGSAFPGQGKTIGIAGHRTTYLAPFRRIEEIQKGDEITVQMPYATFTYEVEKSEIVDPNEIAVVENCPRGEYCEGDEPYERLVLTACHPLYSAAQRYVQFARLTDVSLFASGERRWQDP